MRILFPGLLLCALAAAQSPSCPVQDLALNTTADGTLAASDCRFRDAVSGSTLDTYVRIYRMNVAETGVLTAAAKAADFRASVHLYRTGSPLLLIQSGPTVLASVTAGSYLLLVTSANSGAVGAFTLESRFELPRACPAAQLNDGQSVAADLSASDCRYLDLRPPSTGAAYVDRYRIALEKAGVLTLELKSTAFDALLRIYNSADSQVARNDDNGESTDSRIVVSLEPGSYTVYASSIGSSAGTGAYLLSAALGPLRSCTARELKPGETANGTFTEESCRILDMFEAPETDATYADEYRLKIAQRSVVTIDMKSAAVDSYLVLFGPDDEYITENGDADYETADARIMISLEPGTYSVLANTSDVGMGSYTLRATVEDPRPCPVKDLGAAESASGTLNSASCRVLDFVSFSEIDAVIAPFRLKVDQRAMIAMEMASAAFEPYLVLFDSGMETLLADALGRNSGNARFDLLMPSGTYLLLASTLERMGPYTVRTQSSQPRDCAVQDIDPNGSGAGALRESDCRIREFLELAPVDSYGHRYRVAVPADGTLEISLKSTAFMPVLFVFDSTGRVEDVAFETSAAKTTTRLKAGTYTIVVTTVEGATGAYTLDTKFTPAN